MFLHAHLSPFPNQGPVASRILWVRRGPVPPVRGQPCPRPAWRATWRSVAAVKRSTLLLLGRQVRGTPLLMAMKTQPMLYTVKPQLQQTYYAAQLVEMPSALSEDTLPRLPGPSGGSGRSDPPDRPARISGACPGLRSSPQAAPKLRTSVFNRASSSRRERPLGSQATLRDAASAA